MLVLLTAKPVLIGLHLGFAILGIDAFLWLLGEFVARAGSASRRMFAAAIGLAGFIGSWLAGGYYYVNFYGTLVKPVIIKGSAPWAHSIAMEAKEHIFLFVVPMAITALLLSRLDNVALDSAGLRKPAIFLAGTLAGIGLAVGLMGYIISAAARWGVL